MRLQPRCSERTEKESGDSIITTRLLVPSSRIGCLIGKGGAIISDMRNATRASIRILSKENLPKVASEDDEMVQVEKLAIVFVRKGFHKLAFLIDEKIYVLFLPDQITGDLNVASTALLQVTMRLRANIFEMEGALAPMPPPANYLPIPMDMSDGSRYGSRDSKPRGRGYPSNSGRYDSGEYPPPDSYGAYGGSQVNVTHLDVYLCSHFGA